MNKEGAKSGELKDVVVRICPACGVVNPSGPSRTCPHLQLARFDGLSNEFDELLTQVASARCNFDELVGKLKTEIKEALRKHEAEIETRKDALKSGGDKPMPKPHRQAPALNLENPNPPSRQQAPAAKRKTRKAPPPIDPRQLELISREPPKGEA